MSLPRVRRLVAQTTDTGKQIVVERLTKNVTEDHLREIFGQYGEIHDMDVPLSRQCKAQTLRRFFCLCLQPVLTSVSVSQMAQTVELPTSSMSTKATPSQQSHTCTKRSLMVQLSVYL